ncbi:hypothetical protein FOZ62_012890 [Perkinsus olseni]|uniref:Reverse transcriptase domain-containing protein n=1 Tax=Perkinsus olseni TaxID=32597 RepID=A0A7J6N0T5_PEROL|nr:hypothetical protein FOZ62_012890 [Perkinsus olseni]
MARSASGRKRQQERRRAYREGKRTRREEEGGPGACEPSREAAGGESWEENIRRLAAEFPKPAPFVDGGGMRQPTAGGETSRESDRLTERVRECVLGCADQWLSRLDVESFMDTFVTSSRREQEALSAFQLAALLRVEGFGEIHTLLEKATTPPEVEEDLPGVFNIATGAAIGITCPMMEDSSIWPEYQERPRKRGEPEALLTWEQSEWPAFEPESQLMASLVDQKGRSAKERGEGSNETERNLEGFTGMLERLKDIEHLVTSTREGGWFLEWDARAAYRSIYVRKEEQPFLVVSDPRSNASQDDVLWEKMVPFGLSSSASIFVRWNSAIFRLAKRLFPNGCSLVYIDDVTWRIASEREAVSLLLLSLCMGLDLEWSKVHILREGVRVLGYEIGSQTDADGGQASLAIPAEKREAVWGRLKEAEKRGRLEKKQLDSMIGKLGWCCQLLRQHKRLLTPWYALQSTMEKKALRSVALGGKVAESLRQFLAILSWTSITDGSLYGIGGVITDGRSFYYCAANKEQDEELWAKLMALRGDGGSDPTSGDISYIEMVAAFCGVMVAFERMEERDVVHVGVLQLYTDNSPVASAVTRMRSSSSSMQRPLKWLAPYAGRLVAAHLPGKENGIADQLSRAAVSDIKVPETWVRCDIVKGLCSIIDAEVREGCE